MSKLEWGDFLLADGGRGRGRGRGGSRGPGRGRGDFGGCGGDPPFGPGLGRGVDPPGLAGGRLAVGATMLCSERMQQWTWRWTSTQHVIWRVEDRM